MSSILKRNSVPFIQLEEVNTKTKDNLIVAIFKKRLEKIRREAHNGFRATTKSGKSATPSAESTHEQIKITSFTTNEIVHQAPFMPYNNGYDGGCTARNVLYEDIILYPPNSWMIILIPWKSTPRGSDRTENLFWKWNNSVKIHGILHNQMRDNHDNKILQVPAVCVRNLHRSFLQQQQQQHQEATGQAQDFDTVDENAGLQIAFFDAETGRIRDEVNGWNMLHTKHLLTCEIRVQDLRSHNYHTYLSQMEQHKCDSIDFVVAYQPTIIQLLREMHGDMLYTCKLVTDVLKLLSEKEHQHNTKRSKSTTSGCKKDDGKKPRTSNNKPASKPKQVVN